MASSSFNPANDLALCIAKLEKETFSFRMQIENYTRLAAIGETITSPIMRGGPRSNHSWKLSVNPRPLLDGKCYFGVFVELVEFGNGKVNTDFGRKLALEIEFSVLDENNHSIKTLSFSKEVAKQEPCGYPDFFISGEIIGRVFRNDTLTVHCRVETPECLTTQLVSPDAASKEKRYDEVTLQFGRLLDDSVLTDITIQAPTRTFPAHKAILAAASPVFTAMFNTQMWEKKSNSFVISDFNADIVKAMLQHIYKGHTALLTKQSVDQLIQIADKYDLKLLKQDCESLIIANLRLTVETCLDKLVLANYANSTVVKARILKFVRGHLAAVKSSKSWKRLRRTQSAVLLDLI